MALEMTPEEQRIAIEIAVEAARRAKRDVDAARTAAVKEIKAPKGATR